jgi:hypothetical protein
MRKAAYASFARSGILFVAILMLALPMTASADRADRSEKEGSVISRLFNGIFRRDDKHRRKEQNDMLNGMVENLRQNAQKHDGQIDGNDPDNQMSYVNGRHRPEYDPDAEESEEAPQESEHHAGNDLCNLNTAYNTICPEGEGEEREREMEIDARFHDLQLEYFKPESGDEEIAGQRLGDFQNRFAGLEKADDKNNFPLIPKAQRDSYLAYLQGVTPDLHTQIDDSLLRDTVIEGMLLEHRLAAGHHPDKMQGNLKTRLGNVNFHTIPDAKLLGSQKLWNKWMRSCHLDGGGDNGFAVGNDIYICPGRWVAALNRARNIQRYAILDVLAGAHHEFGHLAGIPTPSQDACIKQMGERYQKDSVIEEYKADWRAAFALAIRTNWGPDYMEGANATQFLIHALKPFCGRSGPSHPLARHRIMVYVGVARLMPESAKALGCPLLSPQEASQFSLCGTHGRVKGPWGGDRI